MIDDTQIDELRRIADQIRSQAAQPGYGYFAGGDPRDFTPDPEMCSAAEMEAHKAACEAWERGEQAPLPGPHVEVEDMSPEQRETFDAAVRATGSDPSDIVGGHMTVASFGMGMQTYYDDTLTKLAQDLDDWIDRARQVSL